MFSYSLYFTSLKKLYGEIIDINKLNPTIIIFSTQFLIYVLYNVNFVYIHQPHYNKYKIMLLQVFFYLKNLFLYISNFLSINIFKIFFPIHQYFISFKILIIHNSIISTI